jgi:hypothetical protein
MRLRTHCAALVLIAAAIVVGLTVSGCADQGGSELVPVTGKVRLDGEPLRFGTVTFQPSRGQPARGEINERGEFTLSTYRPGDGATVGRHKVKIACYASQDPGATELAERPSESLGTSLIPDRYTRFDTSGVAVAVLAGGNRPFDIALRSESDVETPDDAAAASDQSTDPQGKAILRASAEDQAPVAGPPDIGDAMTDSNP